jgi:type VI secretion system secreted protein Hcp
MPNPIYVWFTGVKQGAIDGWGSWSGEDDQRGREGSSLVQEFEHKITIPRDPQSGLASGRRKHHPVQIVKRMDKASPKLYQALCEGERFSEVVFKWYRIDEKGAGGQVHYFTTTLEEAVLTEMKDWFPITADEGKAQYSHFESLAFTYRKIKWAWEDGTKIETEDDWKAG